MNLNTLGKIYLFQDFGIRDALPGEPTGPDDPAFKKRILCEGDSWFSLGAIPSDNLLTFLQFAEPTLLCNLARSGETIKKMSTISQNPDLEKLIRNPQFLTVWDAIFLSGGGNDLLDRIDQILCSPSVGAGAHLLDYVSNIELSLLKQQIQTAYMDIAAYRDGSRNESVPIVTHLYDYPTPRNAKARFLSVGFKGPWFYQAFKQHDITQELWISLTDYLFEWLGTVLIDLTGKIDNFHIIQTHDTLTRAALDTTGEDGDWLNEIHPSSTGYRKLSQVVSPALNSLLY